MRVGSGTQRAHPVSVGTLSIWNAALAAVGTTPTAVACIGDSVTAGTGASDSAHRWTTLMQGQFTTDYGSGKVTVNVDGQSAQPSSRFTTPANYALGSPDPRLVIYEIGLNDMSGGVTADTFRANVLDFISDVRATLATDPSFLLIVSQWVGSGYSRPWEDYVDVLYQIAALDAHVVICDVRAGVAPVSTTNYDPDLVHLNDTGHALYKALVYDAIT